MIIDSKHFVIAVVIIFFIIKAINSKKLKFLEFFLASYLIIFLFMINTNISQDQIVKCYSPDETDQIEAPKNTQLILKRTYSIPFGFFKVQKESLEYITISP